MAYSRYSRAADLGHGIPFYAILGVGAAALCIAAAIAAALQGLALARAVPIYAGAVLALLHTLATTQAAPTNFSQRKTAPDDEAALAGVFDRFARWQALSCVLQVVNFRVNLWELVSLAGY